MENCKQERSVSNKRKISEKSHSLNAKLKTSTSKKSLQDFDRANVISFYTDVIILARYIAAYAPTNMLDIRDVFKFLLTQFSHEEIKRCLKTYLDE